MKRSFFTVASLVLAASCVFADEISTKNAALVQSIEAKKLSAAEAGVLSVDKISQEIVTTGTAGVIVTLRQAEAFSSMEAADWANPASLSALQAANTATADAVLARVGKRVKVRQQFKNFAGFSTTVDAAGLEMLKNDPDVLCIQPDNVRVAQTKQGIPLMQALDYTRGLNGKTKYDGTGVSIAICDTGVDYNHPQLGGGGFPNTKVIGGYNTGDNIADPIPQGQPHGTECAGTAAGNVPADGTPGVGDYQGGVAPGAKIYALKISTGATGSSLDSAMYGAWDWCVTNKNKDASNPIMIISTSFGGGQYAVRSDGNDPAGSLSSAVAVSSGITLFASSGNEGYCDALASPAALSNIISVGAVYDANIGTVGFDLPAESCLGSGVKYEATAADKVTCYSNSSASMLDIFAPSHNNATTGLSGTYSPEFGGTSAACPYAAGAGAALQSAAKAKIGRWLTPQEVRSVLAKNGDNLTDTKVAVTKPRVNLENSINALTALNTQPANDHFADAYLFSGPIGVATGSNSGATLEAGEPTANPAASVWYKVIPGARGTLTVDVKGSSYSDAKVAVYTGSALSALTLQASADISGSASYSVPTATMNDTVFVAVSSTGTGRGNFKLNWTFVKWYPARLSAPADGYASAMSEEYSSFSWTWVEPEQPSKLIISASAVFDSYNSWSVEGYSEVYLNTSELTQMRTNAKLSDNQPLYWGLGTIDSGTGAVTFVSNVNRLYKYVQPTAVSGTTLGISIDGGSTYTDPANIPANTEVTAKITFTGGLHVAKITYNGLPYSFDDRVPADTNGSRVLGQLGATEAVGGADAEAQAAAGYVMFKIAPTAGKTFSLTSAETPVSLSGFELE